MFHVPHDLRYALRTLRRQPGISLVIILALAIGIGANTAIFNFFLEFHWYRVNAPDPERLFFIETGTQQAPNGRTSYENTRLYQEALADIGEVSAWALTGAILSSGENDEARPSIFGVGSGVSPAHFDFFGVGTPEGKPWLLGRGFLPEEFEKNGPRVAVLDYTYWSRHLDADRDILGKTVRFNRLSYTVVGVAPLGFENTGLPHQIYIPMARLDEVSRHPRLDDPENRSFIPLLRLHPGAPVAERVAEAEARLAVLAQNLDRERSLERGATRRISLDHVESNNEAIDAAHLMLYTAVGLLLFLACANVANLLLARAAARQREIAVFTAIGASHGRIARRLLTESLLLSFAGGAVGLAFSRGLTAFMDRYYTAMPIGFANLFEGNEWRQLDHRVLIFTFVVSALTGCLFGLAPIVHAVRTDLVSALKTSGADLKPGRRLGARQLLVVTQVTLSTLLVLGTALLVRSTRGLETRDLGFDTEQQVLAAVAPTPPPGPGTERRAASRRLYEIGRRALAALPGVEAATLVSAPPGGYANQTQLQVPARGDESSEIDHMEIGPDFFTTYAIHLYRGRVFDDRDRAGARGAVIVNRTLADRFFDGDALGHDLVLDDLSADVVGDGGENRFTVVGVAPDIRHGSRRDDPAPLAYLPIAQVLSGAQLKAVARVKGTPVAAIRTIRRTLIQAHPDLALVDIGTYERQMAADLWAERMRATVTGLLGALGLALACLGIYSVMSCSVSYRLRELGIRLALGAGRRDVVRLVLGEASRLVLGGILLGVAVTLVLGRILKSLLYGVAPHEPGIFLSLPFALGVVALAAAWLPARRAGQLDPKIVLQEE